MGDMKHTTPEPHEGMNPVSPKLTTARYIGTLPWWVLIALGFAAAGVWVSPWFYLGTTVAVVMLIWMVWLIPQQVRRLGWLETDDELLLTRGKLWHTYTVIPYGRIQFVDVTAGPIERAFRLKTLKLHTASATTDTTLPGLETADADQLRQRLTVRARERMSGL